MKFNDIDIENWKNTDINVDSLWIIKNRDNSGKHANVYHGNFIPQIPNQLIRRYTKQNEVVLDVFLGSGTTLFECEKLQRSFIGFDINAKIIEYVRKQMNNSDFKDYFIFEGTVTDKDFFTKKIQEALNFFYKKNVNFIIMHPPYLDIIKFTENKNDLSQISDLTTFVRVFNEIVANSLCFLEKNRYFAVVIGDVYKNSEVVPLAFYVLDGIKRHFKVKLKGIVVKNIEGNRGKLGQQGIWKYRALKSDYFLFKHEYILIFKKDY